METAIPSLALRACVSLLLLCTLGASGSRLCGSGRGAFSPFFGLGRLFLLLEGQLQHANLGQPEDVIAFPPALRLFELRDSLGPRQDVAIGNGTGFNAQALVDRHRYGSSAATGCVGWIQPEAFTFGRIDQYKGADRSRQRG